MEDWNYEDYAFTMDFSLSSYGDEYFTAGAKLNIARLFELYGIPSTIIEVGVFEGNTTFWISDVYSQLNKDLIIHAIDPHVGSTDMPEEPLVTYNHFIHNLSVNAYKNINYIRKHSEDGLIDLINQNVEADFIYVDGNHQADATLADACMCFGLLNPSGFMLFDDYLWDHLPDVLDRGKMSIDAFVNMFLPNIHISSIGYQFLIQKKA